jgi:hypothetical protein
MKQCPTCSRTYADALTFCLDDGSVLSDVYDPEATLVAPTDPTANPTKTQASPMYQPPQTISRGRNYSLVYAVVVLLALIVGGGIMALLRSGTNDSLSNEVPAKNEPQVKSEMQNTPPPPPKPVRGTFQVYATSPEGTPFTNTFSKPILVEFQASGQWTFWNKIGLHSAAGHPNYPHAESGYPIPSRPPGCLVVQRATGHYEYFGEERAFRVEPNERVIFVMNEDLSQAHGAGFADNRGTLAIAWECQDCTQ